MAYHWTLHIEAPPEKVFDTLADVEHHPEWANEKAKLTMCKIGRASCRERVCELV